MIGNRLVVFHVVYSCDLRVAFRRHGLCVFETQLCSSADYSACHEPRRVVFSSRSKKVSVVEFRSIWVRFHESLPDQSRACMAASSIAVGVYVYVFRKKKQPYLWPMQHITRIHQNTATSTS